MRDGQPADIDLPPTFSVLLRGAQPGVALDELSERLAPIFKCTPEQVLRLLGRPNVVVKRGVVKAKAQRYVSALLQAGAAGSIEAELPEPAPAPALAPVAAEASPAPAESPEVSVLAETVEAQPVLAEAVETQPAIAETVEAQAVLADAAETSAFAIAVDMPATDPGVADEPPALPEAANSSWPTLMPSEFVMPEETVPTPAPVPAPAATPAEWPLIADEFAATVVMRKPLPVAGFDEFATTIKLNKSRPADEDPMQRWLERHKDEAASASIAGESDADPFIDLPMAQLAMGQKLIIDAILLNVLFGALRRSVDMSLLAELLCALGIGALCLYGVLRIASGLQMSTMVKVLCAVGAAVPLLGVIVLVVLSTKASKRLRDAGYSVGLLGVSSNDIDQMSGTAGEGGFSARMFSAAGLGVVMLCVLLGKTSNTPASVDPLHPCDFIGQWTVTNGSVVHQATLSQDGSYLLKPATPPQPGALKGKWELRQGKLTWYEAGQTVASTRNDFIITNVSKFSVIEKNGTQSHYQRTRALPGSCLK
jgi:hypothetical protein